MPDVAQRKVAMPRVSKPVSRGKPVTWRHIKQLEKKVRSLRPGDPFLIALTTGALRVGQDKENPLRGNLLASALREMVGHLLHTLAPDDQVRNCVWFKQDPNTPTVTRKQRAVYIVQAGLPAEFSRDQLTLDAGELAKPLLDVMDQLNRWTHVRPETILSKPSEIRLMAANVMGALPSLWESAKLARKEIGDAVSEAVHNAVLDHLLGDTIQDLDVLSTHTSIEGHSLDEVDVQTMDSATIVYVISGDVYVELQYGSDADVRSDLGGRSSDTFPYTARVTSSIAHPMDPTQCSVEDLIVDNSSFYE